jgi:opacity protein-like surface antigen
MRNTIIKTILSIFLLTSTTYATNMEKFYVKMGVGLNQISPIHFQTNDLNGKIKLTSRFPLIQVGTGYDLTESIRTELSLDHYFLFLSDETSTNVSGDAFKLNYKTKISAAMINAYKDITNFGIFTPFIGGGIGVSLLQDKATGIGTNTESGISEVITSMYSQQVYRFVYKLSAGVDINLTDNSTFDLSYNYLNLGRNKPRMPEGMIARDYLVHNVTASVRFNF